MAEKKARKLWLFEKCIFIGLAALVDVAEIVLDCFLVGAVVNRIIDIVFVIILCLWLLLTGRMNSQIIKLTIATFAGEEIPIVDLLPLWTAEVVYIIHLIDSGKVKTYSIGELAQDRGQGLAIETAGSMSTPPGAKNVPGAGQIGKSLEQKAEKQLGGAAKKAAEGAAGGIASEMGKEAQSITKNTSEKTIQKAGGKNTTSIKGRKPEELSDFETPSESKNLLGENERLARTQEKNPDLSEAMLRKMADDERRSEEAATRLGAYANRESARTLRDNIGGQYQNRTPEEQALREKRRKQVARGRTIQEVKKVFGDNDIS